MGSLLEPALLRVGDRMRSDDLRWTVMALGDPARGGRQPLEHPRDGRGTRSSPRAELRREVKTLSAEGKLSGYVLAALPVGLFLYMLVANREYVSFFWTNPIGYVGTGRPGHPLHPRLHLDAQTRADRGLMDNLIPLLAAVVVFVAIVYVGLLVVRGREARIKRRSLALVAGYASSDPHSALVARGAAGLAHPRQLSSGWAAAS